MLPGRAALPMRRILVGSLAVLAFGVVAARAGTAIRMDIPALVEGAQLVVEVRVLATRAVRGPNNRIETEYALAVDRTFLGEAQASRSIRLPGGVLEDGRGMIVPGLRSLAAGEDAILFLSGADSAGMRMPVGLAQGELRIVTDLRGRKRIARDQAGLELVDAHGGAVAPADAAALFDYADVVARIEAAAAAKHARAQQQPAGPRTPPSTPPSKGPGR
jgi:hypothetical protein